VNLRRAGPLAPCALLALAAACAGAPGGHAPAAPEPRPAALDAAGARQVLVRFSALLEAGDYDRAYLLLGPGWRARSSPARLARDHAGAGPAARDAVSRARRAGATGAVTLEGGRARVALGEGREAVLVAEGGVWRVDALEEREKARGVR